MPILAAYDDWWLASPRFRHFQAPPSGKDSLIGRPGARMGLRFAGTLMHRALPVAVVSDGYILLDEPFRVTVSWRTPALQEAHESDLVQAAQRFRSLGRSEEGPVDTDLLIADFLFMLMQRAGELAFHADFAMGARRAEPEVLEDDLDGGATWIFGGGPAGALLTVGLAQTSSIGSAGRLVGWPDGTVYAVDENGETFEISSDPEIVAMIVGEVRRKHRRDAVE